MPYFDHNATTPLVPVAREAWLRANDEAWQNPASPHRAGARVAARLAQARAHLAALLACDERRLLFTSGATEAARLAARHLAATLPAEATVLVNPTEHPCVLDALAGALPGRLRSLPVTAAGVVEPAALESALVAPASGRVGAIAVMAANNETGVLQPWRELGAVARARGVRVLCDASQWLGKLPAAGLADAADLVLGAGHKFGAPKGVGFLVLPAGVDAVAGHRAGTADYPAAAALVAALAEAEERHVLHESTRLAWRERFENDLIAAVPGAEIVGAGAERLWNTVLLLAPAGENQRWVVKLDKRGCEVSTGSACASGSDQPSHVLAALGVPPERARRSLRLSAGWSTTEADWAALLAALRAVHAELNTAAVIAP
jgi:cysteine desulfurase